MVNLFRRYKKSVTAVLVASLYVSFYQVQLDAVSQSILADLTPKAEPYRSYQVLKDLIMKGNELRKLDEKRELGERLLNELFKTKDSGFAASPVPQVPAAASPDMRSYYLRVFDAIDAKAAAAFPYTPIANKGVFYDVEMFSDRDDNIMESVAAKVDRSWTQAGAIEIRNMLLKPYGPDKIDELIRRQNIIKTLADDDKLYNVVTTCLKVVKEHEHVIAEIGENANLIEKLTTLTGQDFYARLMPFSSASDLKKSAGWMSFFRVVDNAVRTGVIGTAAVSAIAAVLFGANGIHGFTQAESKLHGYDRERERHYGFMSPSVTYATAGQSLGVAGFAAIVFLATLIPLIRLKSYNDKGQAVFRQLLKLMINYSMFFKALEAAGQSVAGNEYLSHEFPVQEVFKDLLATASASTLVPMLKSPTFEDAGANTHQMHQSYLISATMHAIDLNTQVARVMKVIGQLDAFCSVATLYRERRDVLKNLNDRVAAARGAVCFPKYVTDSTSPYMKISGGWCAKLNPDGGVVKNDAILGKGVGTPFSLWTGANASGKSTYLKMVMLNVLLAQTLTISCCDSMEFTPFSAIVSMMNTKDDTGSASLFQAELDNYKELSKKLSAMPKGNFTLLILDEAFRSTDHGAGAIILSGLLDFWVRHYSDRMIALCSTHLQELSVIEELSQGEVKNWKFVATKGGIDAKGNPLYIYSYKAVQGCMQYDESIAINLLKKEGFDQSIIDFGKEACAYYEAKKQAAQGQAQVAQPVVASAS